MQSHAHREGSLVLDAYVLQRRIGSSQVFDARRRSDGERVVIRMIEGLSALQAQGVLSVADRARQVHHPAFAALVDCGREPDGTVCIVSQYAAGQSLNAWIDSSGIPPLASAVGMVRRLCLGLHEAHAKPLFHHALHARNLCILPARGQGDGRLVAKLLDLGIAPGARPKRVDLHAAQFLAPEQLTRALREDGQLEPSADACTNTYACGALLYYLCTGGPPFASHDLEGLVVAQARGRLAPPSRINPLIPASLCDVILRALAVDRQERYADAAELAEALNGVLSAQGASGVRPRAVPPTAEQFQLSAPEASTDEDAAVFDDRPTSEVTVPKDDAPTVRPPAPDEVSAEASSEDEPHVEVETVEADDHVHVKPTVRLPAAPRVPGLTGSTSTPPPLPRAATSSPPPRSSAPLGSFSSTPPQAPSQPPMAAEDPWLDRVQQDARRAEASMPPAGQAQPRDDRTRPTPKPAPRSAAPSQPAPPPLLLHSPEMPKRSSRKLGWVAGVGMALLCGAGLYLGLRQSAEDDGVVVTSLAPASDPFGAGAPDDPAEAEDPQAGMPRVAVAEPHPADEPTGASAPTGAAEPSEHATGTGREAQPEPRVRRHRKSARHTARSQNPRRSDRGHGSVEEAERSAPAVEAPSEHEAPAQPAVAARDTSRADAVPSPGPPAASTTSPPTPSAADSAPEPAEAADTLARPGSSVRRTIAAGANTRPAPAPVHKTVEKRPLRAKAAIRDLAVRGSLATSVVRRAVQRVRGDFTSCYARAAQAAGRNDFGSLAVQVEIDVRGRARSPRATGASLPGLAACVQDAASRLTTRLPPDTGTVTASWKLVYSP